MSFVLEACVDSVESAENAARGGATRLELCGNLVLGGTTPGEDLLCMVQERVSLPVRVLLRPRFGDFLYSDAEFELLRRQVDRFVSLGVEGIAVGILRPEGTIDEERMAELISLSGGCGVTLHRAFDLCRDPMEALETARWLGIDTILTSGQQASCIQGAGLLRELTAASGGDPQILVGAGVTAEVIRALQPKTGADAFHMSGKRTVDSQMVCRREGVPMGLPGLSEYEIWQCSEDAIRAARQALESLCGT